MMISRYLPKENRLPRRAMRWPADAVGLATLALAGNTALIVIPGFLKGTWARPFFALPSACFFLSGGQFLHMRLARVQKVNHGLAVAQVLRAFCQCHPVAWPWQIDRED